ncbi:hypothetical protein TBK1r_72210 [Stieleria magnilauensis]|uniref:Uncharacterized protein n=1 Tax=Stieleria magnilauensis TaxID=2527963 RepID=A0ABX5Y1Q8_9BACT|nr:hypothetical protein TBK1r_72210 [Planctomycetes bacterium TBK1r]
MAHLRFGVHVIGSTRINEIASIVGESDRCVAATGNRPKAKHQRLHFRTILRRRRQCFASSDSTVTAITIGAVLSGPLTSSIVSITSCRFGITAR